MTAAAPPTATDVADFEWQPAVDGHAAALAGLAFAGAVADAEVEQARSFLRSWRVELAIEAGRPKAAVAVLPPSPGRHRGHGAWWIHDDERIGLVVERLKLVAATVPGLEVVQVSVPSGASAITDVLAAADFGVAYPVWTMAHTGVTWPEHRLPAALHLSAWTEVDLRSFHRAYADAYQDQRLVEPHSEDAWVEMTADHRFEAGLSAVALDSAGAAAAFVLAFSTGHGGVELGPIGTVPAWRGRGVSSALLSLVLAQCRDRGVEPITLSVDGDSPTRAQRLYERLGFRTSQVLIAYHCHIDQERP